MAAVAAVATAIYNLLSLMYLCISFKFIFHINFLLFFSLVIL